MRRCTGLRSRLLIPIDEPHELAKEIASFMGGLLLSRYNG
jgi:hypothetical protein